MIGQCVLEKSSVHLTNLPGDYLKITSGLGEALPRNLLIVPLLLNQEVFGVIELASFRMFEPHQRMFIEKLAESIASTVSNVRINEQTRSLLHETQQQAEQVRSQEEEMRQSMEELSATQEEMQRALREVEAKEAYVSQLLNVSTDAIFTLNREYKLISWNKAFAYRLEQSGLRAEKGMTLLDWYAADERKEQATVFDRVLSGESFDLTTTRGEEEAAVHLLSIYAPLRNEKGIVYEAAVFMKDITGMMQARKQAERMHYEAQSKAEELKAQEEELRQNLEELSAQQEEMQRILRQVEAKETYLSQLLNVSSDAIYTIDREYKLVSWNVRFADTLARYGSQVAKGLDTLTWYTDAEKKVHAELYDRALEGETFEHTETMEQEGRRVHHLTVYAPLRDEKGAVVEVAVFAKDITAMSEARARAEKLSFEAQEQTEQLRAQEEEMKQSMEELAATQDEMERVIAEHKQRLAYALQLLDATDDMVFTVDSEYRLVSWNRSFEESQKRTGFPPEKGMNLLECILDAEVRKEKSRLLKRVFKGESFQAGVPIDREGQNRNLQANYKPLRNEKGEVIHAVVLTRHFGDR
jgi:PAS domain S-box-containing protein